RPDPLEHGLARDAERGELTVRDRALDDRRLHAELDERLDVRPDSARESPHLGLEAGVEDERDRPRIFLGDTREARLDAIDPRRRESLCNLKFLLWREDDSHRLLAIAERRVVEADGRARLRLERLRVEIAGPH